MTTVKKPMRKMIIFHVIAIIITIALSFITGIYAMLWYTQYEDEQGLKDFLGGEENYKQLRTITHKFEKVYTLSNGEEFVLTGDDIKHIENN